MNRVAKKLIIPAGILLAILAVIADRKSVV